jgi:hypothetical protein
LLASADARRAARTPVNRLVKSLRNHLEEHYGQDIQDLAMVLMYRPLLIFYYAVVDLIRDAGPSRAGILATAQELFDSFIRGHGPQMHAIQNNPSLLGESRKAAARHALHGKAMRTTAKPLTELNRASPHLTPIERSLQITLRFFCHLYLCLGEYDFCVYLDAGGRRPRSFSF